MDVHLLDTSFASSFFNQKSKRYEAARQWVAAQGVDPKNFVVSCVTLGEIAWGAELWKSTFNDSLTHVDEMLATLRESGDASVLQITRHTVDAYAQVKSQIAVKVFGNGLKQRLGRKKLGAVEVWKHELTAKTMSIDENDLWLCASAIEHNFTLVTADRDFSVATAAYPALRVANLLTTKPP